MKQITCSMCIKIEVSTSTIQRNKFCSWCWYSRIEAMEDSIVADQKSHILDYNS